MIRPSDPASNEFKRSIRDASLELFAKEGVQGVSVAKICRHAQVANGTFYNFYKNKGELVDEFLKEAYSSLAAKLREANTLEGSAADLHRGDVKTIVRFTAENRALISIAMNDEGARKLADRDLHELFVEQRADAFREGMAVGFYRPGIDPEFLARCEIGLMSEMLNHWVDSDLAMPEEELVDALVAVRMRLTNGMTEPDRPDG